MSTGKETITEPAKTAINILYPAQNSAGDQRQWRGADWQMFMSFLEKRYLDGPRPPEAPKKRSLRNQEDAREAAKYVKYLEKSADPKDKKLAEALTNCNPELLMHIVNQDAEIKRLTALAEYAQHRESVMYNECQQLAYDPDFEMWTKRLLDRFWDNVSASPEYKKMRRWGVIVIDLQGFHELNKAFSYTEANKIGQALGHQSRATIERRREINPEWKSGNERRVKKLLRFFWVKVMGDELVLVIPNIGSRKKLFEIEREVLAALEHFTVSLIAHDGREHNVPILFHHGTRIISKNNSLPAVIFDILNKEIRDQKLLKKSR